MNLLDVVVTRSARSKPSAPVTAKAIVVAPFGADGFVISPGGDGQGTRQYDPGDHATGRTTIASPATLKFRPGTVTESTDALAEIVSPVVGVGDPPDWVARRGYETRCYDRAYDREVWGPHRFEKPSDLIVTNGLVWFWCGPAGAPASVMVQAVGGGSWRHEGYLYLSRQNVTSAHLIETTHDRTTVEIRCGVERNYLQLRRGERMVRITSSRKPTWTTMPAARQSYGGTAGTGHFGAALAFDVSDVVEFNWPATKQNWSIAGWWVPAAGSGSQPDSGIIGTASASNLAAALYWRNGRLEWEQGGVTLVSAALSFSANQPVFVAMRYSTTSRSLSVKTSGGSLSHTSDTAGTGTASANYRSFWLAPTFGDLGGYSDTYSDTYEGAGNGTWAFDNLMVFADKLTNAETAALVASATPLGGLPSPEGRLVFYAPFDITAPRYWSAPTAGAVHEVTSGGSRYTDAGGLTRGVAQIGGDYGAFLATTDTFDDIADQTAQFAADFEQQIRVR